MATSASQPATDLRPARPRMVGLILLVLMGLCLLFVLGYVQRLAQRDAVAAERVVLEERIAEAKVRNAILTTELAQVNDDAHIAAVARNALNLVQEGDQPLAIIDPPEPVLAPVAGGGGGVRAPVITQPTWQQWFDLVVGGN